MSESSSSSGLGFTGVLAIVFIVLKLVGVINWPWVWVLAPIWIGVIIGGIFLIAEIIFSHLAD